MIDKEFLEILACPACKTEVKLEAVPPAVHGTHSPAGTEPARSGERLVCVSCGRRYPIRDGIPVMLIDEAEAPAAQPGSAARS